MRTARTAPATLPPTLVVPRTAEAIAAPRTASSPVQHDGHDAPGRATALAPRSARLPQLQVATAVSSADDELARLNDAQRNALAAARKTGAMNCGYLRAADPPWVAQNNGLTGAELQLIFERFVERARIHIYFRPDKEIPGGGTMLDSISTRTHLRNQFETHHSNGDYEADLTRANRVRWEANHFRDAYGVDPLIPEERPKYGLVILDGKTVPYAAQYGDAYFVLKPSVNVRTSIAHMDTSDWLSSVATFDTCGTTIATAGHFREIAGQCLDRPYEPYERHGRHPRPTAADYTEAQVHGPIEYARDVEAVVAPARLLGTEHEPKMRAFCERNGIELRWDHGDDVIVPDGEHSASSALLQP